MGVAGGRRGYSSVAALRRHRDMGGYCRRFAVYHAACHDPWLLYGSQAGGYRHRRIILGSAQLFGRIYDCGSLVSETWR